MNTEAKVIRSRSQKQIGDILEEKWRITGVKVIAAPTKGKPPFEPPRLGIFDYTVEPLPHYATVNKLRSRVADRTVGRLKSIADGIMSGRFNDANAADVLFAVDRVLTDDAKANRVLNRLEKAGPLVTFRTVR